MNLSDTQIAAYARAAGFPANAIAVAVAVALAESNGDPAATHKNGNGSTDSGVWQINSIHAKSFPVDYPLRFTPINNARMAKRIWADAGNAWTPWSTFKNGAYSKYLARGNKAAGSNEEIKTATPAASDNFWAKQGFVSGQPAPTGWFMIVPALNKILPGVKFAGTGSNIIDGYTIDFATSGTRSDQLAVSRSKDGKPVDTVAVEIKDGKVVVFDIGDGSEIKVPTPAEPLINSVIDGIPNGYLWIGGGAVLVTLGVLMIAK